MLPLISDSIANAASEINETDVGETLPSPNVSWSSSNDIMSGNDSVSIVFIGHLTRSRVTQSCHPTWKSYHFQYKLHNIE